MVLAALAMVRGRLGVRNVRSLLGLRALLDPVPDGRVVEVVARFIFAAVAAHPGISYWLFHQRAGRAQCPSLAARWEVFAHDPLRLFAVAIRSQGSRLCRGEGHRAGASAYGLSQPHSGVSGRESVSKDA